MEWGRIDERTRQMSILSSCEQRRFSFCGSCTPPKRLEGHFELIQASARILGVKAAELSDPPAKCRFCSSCEQRRFSFCGSCTPPKQLEVHSQLSQASSQSLVVKAAELSDPPAKCRFCSSCEQRRFSFCGSCTPPKRLEVHFELIQASSRILGVKAAELSDSSAKCRNPANGSFRSVSPIVYAGGSTSILMLSERDQQRCGELAQN